jgi:hypothetical protein
LERRIESCGFVVEQFVHEGFSLVAFVAAGFDVVAGFSPDGGWDVEAVFCARGGAEPGFGYVFEDWELFGWEVGAGT